MSNLSRKQRSLIREIELIRRIFGFGRTDAAFARGKELTTDLQLTKDLMIRSVVVMIYALVDESLNLAICRKMFGGERGRFEFNRSKRFRAFHHYMLENLPLVKKVEFVKAVYQIPASVSKAIYALNDLRNAIAHSFIPERRRVGPLWNGRSIYTSEGFEEFRADTARASKLLVRRYW